MSELILASTSAVRAALLAGAGVDFQTEDAGVDEYGFKQELLARACTPRDIARSLAEAKAVAVSRRRRQWVIGADQTLDLGGVLIDKASDLATARLRLLSLRAATHHLHAGVALARDGEVVWSDAVSASLTMRSFSTAFLDDYLARNIEAALNSVGCYHLESEGVQLFERIDGDYFAILGLPLLELLDRLRQHGIVRR